MNSIPVDYMHAVLEGVSRLLIGSWFDSKHHAQPCYVGHHVREIDFQLLKQQPPSEFSRPPRSIQKHFKYWKASGTTKLATVLLFAYYACTSECNFMVKKAAQQMHNCLHTWRSMHNYGALFGLMSKSGHLKQLFHGKSKIMHQFLFNTDVNYALQNVMSTSI